MRKPGLSIREGDKVLAWLRRAMISLWAVREVVVRQSYTSPEEKAAREKVADLVGQMLRPYDEAQEAIVKAQRGNLGRG
jgi:hypothetical protein